MSRAPRSPAGGPRRAVWLPGIGKVCAALLVAACRQDMHDQPRYEPLEHSRFFTDGRSARPLPPGTVARGQLVLDSHLATGKVDGEFATTFPFEIDAARLARGRERYEINCAPCHDRTGGGRGMVVQRGMKQPPSFHVERLRAAQPGYFVDVITKGFGAMYDQADRVVPEDRWAIAAYIRALQLSQHAQLSDVPDALRRALEEAK